MLKIFISYRRADTTAFAGRMVERLRAKYGVSSVCIDVDTIPLGVDFRDYINSAIKTCDVLLALIGERWLKADSGQSACRLFDPTDPVRVEIEAALSNNIPVVPVLVGKAQLPLESELPESLSPLVYRTGTRIDEGTDFHHHIGLLIGKLSTDIKPVPPPVEAAPAPAAPVAPAPVATPDPPPRPNPTYGDDRRVEMLSELDSRAPPQIAIEPNLAPIRLNPLQGLAVTGFLLALNSILATLGSMLWTHGHYWPAYMVSALACAYFRFWGLLVIILSPIVSSLLMIGGAPAYAYLPSNALQGILIIAAFVFGKIDPSLSSTTDKVKYLALAVTAPSICGAILAWWLRSITPIDANDSTPVGANDPWIVEYVAMWVTENLTPAIFPGIWLHAVVGSLRRPFSWTKESRWTGWVGLTLEHAVPGTITLFLSIGISLLLVSSRLGEVDVSSNAWNKIHLLADQSPMFRWMVFATSISLLVSIGFAVRQARQAWQLEQAIRRHMPSNEEAERILSRKVGQSKSRHVSLIVFNLNNLSDAAQTLRPQILVGWLNAYFDCLAASVQRFGGQVDHFDPEKSLAIFGFRDEDAHANSSMQCAIDAAASFRQLNDRLKDKQLPGFKVTMGIHSGPVVSGEIGSIDRRHYTIVGETVDAAREIACEAQGHADAACPVVFSLSTAKEAGLMRTLPQRVGLMEISRLSGHGIPIQLYTIADVSLLRQNLILDSTRSI